VLLTSRCAQSDESEFFYNGKLNEVQRERADRPTKPLPPLRWEFAPNEFDTLDEVLEVLRRDRWSRQSDLHLDYYINFRTHERMWIED